MDRYEPNLEEDIEYFTAEDPKEIELRPGTKLENVLKALQEFINNYNHRKITIEEDEDSQVKSPRDCRLREMQDEETKKISGLEINHPELDFNITFGCYASEEQLQNIPQNNDEGDDDDI